MSHGHIPTSLDAAEVTLPAKHGWRKLPMIAGVIGIIGVIATLVMASGGQVDAELGYNPVARRAYYGYLVAFCFFLTIGLGALFFVIIQYTARAAWSVTIRRIAENFMATLPLFALLFIPIALNIDTIFYDWVHPHGHHAHLIEKKQGYLNGSFFTARAVLYFVIWTALALWFRATSVAQDTSGDHQLTRRMQLVSPIAIALYALSSTFAAFDWIMSLDPAWFSTIFGIYIFAGSLVAILACLAASAVLLQRSGMLKGIVTIEHNHDIGKLLFGFTVFWTYIAFSQFILIWYANIPEETMWYYQRNLGSWGTTTILLALVHFIIPFFFLISHHMKRRRTPLLIGAFWMLAVHYLDLYWLIMPTLDKTGINPQFVDVTAMIGVGGLFLAVFGYWMGRDPIVPLKDPRLPEALAFKNYPATMPSSADA